MFRFNSKTVIPHHVTLHVLGLQCSYLTMQTLHSRRQTWKKHISIIYSRMGNSKISEKHHQWSFSKTTTSVWILSIHLKLYRPMLPKKHNVIYPWPDNIIQQRSRKGVVKVRRFDFLKRPQDWNWSAIFNQFMVHMWTSALLRTTPDMSKLVLCRCCASAPTSTKSQHPSFLLTFIWQFSYWHRTASSRLN